MGAETRRDLNERGNVTKSLLTPGCLHPNHLASQHACNKKRNQTESGNSKASQEFKWKQQLCASHPNGDIS